MADASFLYRNRNNNSNNNNTQGRISFFGRAGRNRQTQLMLLTMFGILALLGLLFVARHRATTGAYDTASISVLNDNTEDKVGLTVNEKESAMSGPYKSFLANVNYKNVGKLTSAQLEDLVGMYYAKEPNTSELQALFNKNERIIIREQLPEKIRVIPPNTMVTMVNCRQYYYLILILYYVGLC